MKSMNRFIQASVLVVFCTLLVPVQSWARGAPDSFADLAEKLLPAVVNISTKQTIKLDDNIKRRMPPGMEEFFKYFGQPDQKEDDSKNRRPRTRQRASLGSGFVIDASGIIITNAHVIDKADEITIKFHDGTELDAELVGKDKKLDVAVLRVKSDKPLPHVKFGDDSKSRIGDWVVAIGNPYGLGGTLTAGIVSARNREIGGTYDDYIQTDASINRGNSGGPLFNLNGEVIGINTAIFSPSGGNIGIGFSIPSNQASRVIDQLREFGHTRRGRIGVSIQVVTDEMAESLGMDDAYGAMVTSIAEGGPAEKYGLESGDIIIEFDGHKVDKMRELPRLAADTPIGKKVKITVLRKGRKKNLSLVIDELPEDSEEDEDISSEEDDEEGQSEEMLGMTLENLTDKARKALKLEDDFEGVLIASVDRYGPAGEKGLRRGDVIMEVTQEKVSTVAMVRDRIEEIRTKGRKSVLLKVNRRGTSLFISVKFEEKDEDE